MRPSENLYALLHVRPDVSGEDLRRAYRRLAREYHPDHNGGDARKTERFREVQAAYEVLSDPQTRQIYDRARAEWAQSLRAVLCRACGQANRPRARRGEQSCGACDELLPMPAEDPGILGDLADRAGSRLREELSDMAAESVGKLGQRLARLTHDGIDAGARALSSRLTRARKGQP